jgi:hypothetical protein
MRPALRAFVEPEPAHFAIPRSYSLTSNENRLKADQQTIIARGRVVPNSRSICYTNWVQQKYGHPEIKTTMAWDNRVN